MAVITRRQDSEFEMVTLLRAEMAFCFNEQSSATNDSIGGKGFKIFSFFHSFILKLYS